MVRSAVSQSAGVCRLPRPGSRGITKTGQGVGPSLGIVLATWLGYNATLGPDQPAAVALNMRYLTPTMYLIGGILSLVSYGLIYNLDRKTLNTMKGDLEARHAAH